MRAAARATLVSVGLLACSAASIEVPKEGPTPRASAEVAVTAVPGSPSPAAVASDAPLSERASVYAAAHAAMRAGRRSEARQGFERSVALVPELADHALYHAGHLALEDGDTAAAEAALERLLREHPDSVWLAAAAVDRGRIALAAGSPQAAAGWFERARAAGDPTTADQATLGLAEARSALGELRAAYELADGLRGKPGAVGARARVLGESLEARGPAALGIPAGELALRTARARLREGRAQEARDVLAPLLAEGHPLRGEAALVVARSYGRGAPREAAAAYEIAIRSSRAADVAGTALFERGRIAWNRDEDEAADRDFQALVERFPQHASAAEALYARARIAEARGDERGAIKLYEEVAVRHPGSQIAAESAWRAAFVRYRTGDLQGAAAAFGDLSERDDALYWRARALEQAGDRAAARALYERLRTQRPESGFAWWIDRRIGPPEEARWPGARGEERRAAAASPPALGGAAAYHFGRARILTDLGLRPDAVRELKATEASTGPEPFLLDAYDAAGAHAAAVRLAIRLQQAGHAGVQRWLFPHPYADAFSRGALEARVDPLLLVSMARQESLFDPVAVSPAGARGVLQLMPETAARVAGAPVDASTLADPRTNVALGARYLGSLLARFGGRIVPAVAAYNAGPEPVERWLASTPGVPGDEFVERITYRETRDYVKAVLRNYRAYHLLYGDGDLPSPPLF